MRVLFVCGSNSCRSQMAEGLLRAQAPEVAVASAGVSSDEVHPLAISVMKEIGIELSDHHSKAVPELHPMTFDLVITVCDEARQYCLVEGIIKDENEMDDRTPVLAGVPLHLFWPVPEPSEDLDSFRDVREILQKRISTLVEDGYLAAITESRERLEKVLDALDDGIIVHDDMRRIYLFNRSAERITGYKREDVVGHDCHRVFPSGFCGSQCRFRDGPPEDRLNRQEQEVRFVTSDGDDRRVKMSITSMDMTDRPGQVIARLRDITEVTELRRALTKHQSFRNMVGVSRSMQEVFETIKQVSTSDYPVLVTGESGAGKELVASAIHNESRRKGGPFVPINCGALPDHILESELFGHVRGAFTGAVRNRKGRFELADHGTLFLDEVGELSPTFQVKLLRVLQEKKFDRVGGEESISVDVRIISATNRDLKLMIKEGTFREDLFYRLCVVPIGLPPLRGRSVDIPFLVEQILENIREESQKDLDGVSESTMDLMLSYRWPGNVRELINALRFASVRCSGPLIEPHHLPAEVREADPEPEKTTVPKTAKRSKNETKLTKQTVKQALEDTSGNKVQAAKRLGVGRATLYRFLDRNPM